MRTAIPGYPRSSVVVDDRPPVLSGWTLFGTHPTAAANGGYGHHIASVFADGGNLYLGYGDWTANTGPVDIISLSLTDGSPQTHFSGVHSEAIEAWRTIGGDIYVPWVDTVSGYAGSCGYATNKGGTWHQVDIPYLYHCFDIGSTDGTDLVATGSSTTSPSGGQDAVIRSTDGGTTWAYIEPGYPIASALRVYSAVFPGNGTIYTTAFGGARWDVMNGWQAYPFTSSLNVVSMATRPVMGGVHYDRSFAVDGATDTVYQFSDQIVPHATDGTYVYATVRDARGHVLYRTTGPSAGTITWTPYLSLPTSFVGGSLVQSVEVYSGNIYVGSSGGRVFTAPLPA